MRPQRFQKFAIDTYIAAGLQAEPWSDGTRRPLGIKVRLSSGAEVWHAITAQAREGENYDEPEQPVEKDAPAPMDVPELGTGRRKVADAERYLAALITNAGSREITSAYTYSDREQPTNVPGFGVHFHSGARIFAPFVHALRPGQTPGKEYDLPKEV